MERSAESVDVTPRQLTGVNRLPLAGEIAGFRDRLGPFLASTVLPFTLIVYLALEGAGYDAIVRSEVGVAVWWIVLLGAILGVLPVRRLGRDELLCLGLLLAFALWTALGISWSESSERSLDEVSRVLMLLGVLALAVTAQDREALPRTVRAVGAAIAVIGLLAVLSRLEPSWFPPIQVLPEVKSRLAYPLNYWNGLAALMAMGLPLVLVTAAKARGSATQAIATAAIPVMGLAAYYSFSRGGTIEIAVALTVFFVLYPRRLEAVPVLALGIGGTALVVGAASQRSALVDNLQNATADKQGNEMLTVLLIVCAGVALLRVAYGLALRAGLWAPPTVSRRTTSWALGGLAAVVLFTGLAAGGPGRLSRAWTDFKATAGPSSNTAARLQSASGNGRYQWWSAAVDAYASAPLTGIGPGTFEFWWAEHGSIPGFVRNAHNLYLETLAELGIPGLALMLAVLGSIVAVGIGQFRRADSYDRALLAAALAAAAVFLTAAAIDWVWEMTVIPVALFLLAAPMLRRPVDDGPRPRDWLSEPSNIRVALAGLALVSILVIAVPMLSTEDVRQSQSDASAGRLNSALDKAESAGNLEPFAASPDLQRALVLESQGNLGAATDAARAATQAESTNWRTWLTLSRIEAERGSPEAAVAAFRTARSLNPRSRLFTTTGGGQ
jgi:tetratricopeptide (TPR) repeat protein